MYLSKKDPFSGIGRALVGGGGGGGGGLPFQYLRFNILDDIVNF